MKPFLWYEPSRPICGDEMPKRCRKTAIWYMDGLLFCETHIEKVRQFGQFIRPIVNPVRK